MAESGGQPGNKNATKNKPWAQALAHVAERWPEPPETDECTQLMRGLRLAAFEFWKNTMTARDIGFFKEAADRFDGKPAQTIQGGEEGSQPIAIQIVRFTDVAPR